MSERSASNHPPRQAALARFAIDTSIRSASSAFSSLPKCSYNSRSRNTACANAPRTFARRFGRSAREKSCSGSSSRLSGLGSGLVRSVVMRLLLRASRAPRAEPNALSSLEMNDEEQPRQRREAERGVAVVVRGVGEHEQVEVEEHARGLFERDATTSILVHDLHDLHDPTTSTTSTLVGR